MLAEVIMNIDQLTVLKVVSETGSFSKASEKLHRAKSAVSYAINNLEDELGLQLLDRTNYRPSLTKYGVQLLEKAEHVIESFLEFEKFANTLSKNQELKIRFSITALWPLNEITPILKELEVDFPDTEVVFNREVLSGERLLLRKNVDIAIVELLQNKIDLEQKKIGSLKMPTVISSKHQILKKKGLKLSDLEKFPQIIVRSTLEDRERNFGVIEKAKKWYVNDLDSKLQLIEDGLGWGGLPEHIVADKIKSGRLSVIDIKEFKKREVDLYIARRKDDYHGVVSNYLWDKFDDLDLNRNKK